MAGITYAKAYRDAGLYREYITIQYGSTLEFGGTYESYQRALRHCGRLAKMAGKEVDEVVKDIRDDYRNIETK